MRRAPLKLALLVGGAWFIAYLLWGESYWHGRRSHDYDYAAALLIPLAGLMAIVVSLAQRIVGAWAEKALLWIQLAMIASLGLSLPYGMRRELTYVGTEVLRGPLRPNYSFRVLGEVAPFTLAAGFILFGVWWRFVRAKGEDSVEGRVEVPAAH